MLSLLAGLNSILALLFDLLLSPFQGLPPIWGLVWLSLLTALLFLWLFGRLSNQEAIQQAKNRIRGNLLAVRLFQHDLAVVGRLQLAILADSGRYLKHATLPLLVLIPVLVPILAQVNRHFELRPLQPGESALIRMRVKEAADLERPTRLEAGAGAEVETPSLRVPDEQQALWRLRGLQPGNHVLTFQVGDQTVQKQLLIGSESGVSSIRSASLADLILYPGEQPLSAGLVESVQVDYPALNVSMLGWTTHWLVWFFLFTLIFSLLLKGLFRVEI